jgi:GxxExxY protein
MRITFSEPSALPANSLNLDLLDYLIIRINQYLCPQNINVMLYEDLTKRIIKCAMTVHGTLGNGFQEVIYQRALAIEMQQEGLAFIREMEMPIFYRDVQIGTRRVDFFVEEKIMVELKAIIQLEDVHLAQAMNYLEAYKMRVGLLINFGAKSLQFKRVHNNKP